MSIPTRSKVGHGKNTWVAVAHVKAKEGNDLLGKAAGAFVPVVALAGNETEVVSQMTSKIESYDLDVVKIEDLEPLATALARGTLSSDLVGLAHALTADAPVAFGSFHSYPGEE